MTALRFVWIVAAGASGIVGGFLTAFNPIAAWTLVGFSCLTAIVLVGVPFLGAVPQRSIARQYRMRFPTSIVLLARGSDRRRAVVAWGKEGVHLWIEGIEAEVDWSDVRIDPAGGPVEHSHSRRMAR